MSIGEFTVETITASGNDSGKREVSSTQLRAAALLRIGVSLCSLYCCVNIYSVKHHGRRLKPRFTAREWGHIVWAAVRGDSCCLLASFHLHSFVATILTLNCRV